MKIQKTIEEKLKSNFNPTYLEVLNESYMHSVPPGSESHFKVTIVSLDFQNEKLIDRHKKINKILKEELSGEVHALALHVYTPPEWSQKEKSPNSPKCEGGSKEDS